MYWTWKSVYDIRKKETIAVKIQKSIDDAINQCKNLYDGIYRYNKEIDWIEKYENNRFRKSWIHTINTNTAAIATLLNFINENYTRQITEDDFLFYPDETCEYFRKCLLEHPEIFLPNNDVFITMYFETQLSWNLSIIGQLRSSLTISSYFPSLVFPIGIERGDMADMKQGIDGELKNSENPLHNTAQHKVSRNGLFNFDGDYYWFKKISYDKKYRKNVKTFIIDDSTKVYLFYNSESYNLIENHIHTNGITYFRVHKSLLYENGIMRHTEESQKISDLLEKINQECYRHRISFYVDTDNTGTNLIERVVENDVDTIRFILNDQSDKNLFNMISSFYNNFKTTLS